MIMGMVTHEVGGRETILEFGEWWCRLVCLLSVSWTAESLDKLN